MEHNYSILHQIRDFTLSITLGSLLFLTCYTISHLIIPDPRFEDFSCEFKNKHCREWDKIISEQEKSLAEVSSQTNSSAESSEHLQNQANQLKEEIKENRKLLFETRQARDKLLREANVQAQAKRWYVTNALAIAVLIAAYFTTILPIQIGLIIGGLSLVISESIFTWVFTNHLIKLIVLLIALITVIAVSLKFYRKHT